MPLRDSDQDKRGNQVIQQCVSVQQCARPITARAHSCGRPGRSAPTGEPSMSGDTHDQLAYSEDFECREREKQGVSTQGFLGKSLGHHMGRCLSTQRLLSRARDWTARRFGVEAPTCPTMQGRSGGRSAPRRGGGETVVVGRQRTSFGSETLGFAPSPGRCRQAGGGGERRMGVRRTKKRPTWAASAGVGNSCKREREWPRSAADSI